MIITLIISVVMIISLFWNNFSVVRMPIESGSLLFNAINSYLSNSGIYYLPAIVAAVLLAFEIIFVINLNSKFEITRAKANFFIIVYIIISLMYIPYNILLPEQFANIFLILGMFYILESNGMDDASYNVFNAGLLCGCATLFCINAFLLIFVGIISLLIFRPYRTREWCMIILGTITPILIYATLYFLIFDSINPILDSIKNQILVDKNYNFSQNGIIFFAIMAFWIFIGSTFMINLYPTFNIFTARTFKLLFCMFVLIIGATISPFFGSETLRLAVFPLSFMLVKFFFNLKKGLWSEILISLFIISAIAYHVLWYRMVN
ncbi:MAG: hypothetical protein MJ211_11260 [Bacteroidales bacterium]|nr:hypothetical protein [Bacteroidales bacterium]